MSIPAVKAFVITPLSVDFCWDEIKIQMTFIEANFLLTSAAKVDTFLYLLLAHDYSKNLFVFERVYFISRCKNICAELLKREVIIMLVVKTKYMRSDWTIHSVKFLGMQFRSRRSCLFYFFTVQRCERSLPPSKSHFTSVMFVLWIHDLMIHSIPIYMGIAYLI